MKTFRFGLAADYTISECALNAGDNLWRVRSFGCDCGHDNVYRLERDGTPICGSGNCPGAPGTCWGTPYLVGGSDGPGSLDLNGQKDMQYYGEAYLYVSKTANLSGIPFSSDVGRLWVNDVEVQGSPLTLSLKPGCNHIEWTAYNQNSTPRIRISAPLANYVLRMDSALCE